MPYTIDWYYEDLIILIKLSGDFEDFVSANNSILKLIEESPRPLVHVLVNLKALKKFPNLVGEIQRSLTYMNHPRTGWTIILTDNRFIRFIGYTITQVSKARFRAFNEEAEALQFLETAGISLKSTS